MGHFEVHMLFRRTSFVFCWQLCCGKVCFWLYRLVYRFQEKAKHKTDGMCMLYCGYARIYLAWMGFKELSSVLPGLVAAEEKFICIHCTQKHRALSRRVHGV